MRVRESKTGKWTESHDASTPWDDPRWLEKADGPWQRRLRLQQGWWRETRLGLPAGPRRPGGRLVVSMLPASVGLESNLMTGEAVGAAEKAMAQLRAEKRPGL